MSLILIYILLIFFIISECKKYFELSLSICFLCIFIIISARKFSLFCPSLSCISIFFSVSIYLSLSSPSFLFALFASSFGGALCPIARRDDRASSENPISVTSELKAIGRYRGITRVTAECYTGSTQLPVSVSEWSFFEIDAGARCLSNSLF